MDLYRENLLDHYKNPRNFGKPSWAGDFMFEEINPSCGDKIGVAVKVNPSTSLRASSKQEIGDIRFWGEGCIVSVAAMSMLTEEVKKRKRLENILGITKENVLELLGGKESIPPARYSCALLGFEALQKVLARVKSKRA